MLVDLSTSLLPSLFMYFYDGDGRDEQKVTQ